MSYELCIVANRKIKETDPKVKCNSSEIYTIGSIHVKKMHHVIKMKK